MNLIQRTHRLADTICTAMDREAYVVVGEANPRNHENVQSVGKWVGPKPRTRSRAPFVAHAKFGELALLGDPLAITCTPVDGFELGLGWMGGVRVATNIVAVSKWAEEHDKLLALVLAYGMDEEVRFHHIGHRHPTMEDFRKASTNRMPSPLEVPAADDHIRIYYRVSDSMTANGYYYLEDQFFPEGPCDTAIHWDFATSHPERMLQFIAGAYGEKPTFFSDAGMNDPVGVYWVPEKNGDKIGVMARNRWWEVESSR